MRKIMVMNLRSLITSLGEICNNPVNSFLTILSIGISLTIPASIIILLNNINIENMSWYKSNKSANIYLKQNVTDTEINNLKNLLKQNNIYFNIIKKNDALKTFLQKNNNMKHIINFLPENPIPTTIVINLDNLKLDLNNIKNNPAVSDIDIDINWINKLNALFIFLKQSIYLILFISLTGILLIINNSMNLAIKNKKDILKIMDLIGASKYFIQSEFLYLGFWFGSLSAITAFTIINLSVIFLKTSFLNLITLYIPDYHMPSVPINYLFTLLLFNSIFTTICTYFTTNKKLKQLEN